jgi:uncharacterized protein (TIGR00255 family)
MIRSMTAFSRAEGTGPWGEMTLELRSVNHRFLDVSLRLPEELRAIEPQMRERLAAQLTRGKVDLFLRFKPAETGGTSLQIDTDLAQRVAHASREVDSLLYNPGPVSSMDLLRWPGVLQASEVDPEELQSQALALLDEALSALVAMREREGTKLVEVIEQRCVSIEQVVASVREILPGVLTEWREKLLARLKEMAIELDPQRLEQEAVITAQRMDVDEEMDRLTSHLGEIRRTLKKQGPVGRRLDFLMQELNREANTLGSKSIDTRTTQASVELKVLIEQIREQVQNLE